MMNTLRSILGVLALCGPAAATECEYRAGGDEYFTAVETATGYDVLQWANGSAETVDRCAVEERGTGIERGWWATCEGAGASWLVFSGPDPEHPKGYDIMVLSNTVFFRVCR